MLNTAYIPWTPMKILLEDYSFEYLGETIIIPIFFCFDWASYPRYVSFLFKPNDNRTLEQGLRHDWLYSERSKETERKRADRFFASGLSPLLTRIFGYYGVRLGGRFSWKKDSNYKKYKQDIEMFKTELYSYLSKKWKITTTTKRIV